MATPAPSNISHHSLEKSLCRSKDDGSDQDIHPEKPKEQEEPSVKIYNDNEKGDETKDSSTTSSEEAALQVPPKESSVVRKGIDEEEGESGRERLKRHRMEMGGQVWIPDTWGQENLLKNWIDCTSFDASLVNNSILSARAALIQQRAATTRKTNHLNYPPQKNREQVLV